MCAVPRTVPQHKQAKFRITTVKCWMWLFSHNASEKLCVGCKAAYCLMYITLRSQLIIVSSLPPLPLSPLTIFLPCKRLRVTSQQHNTAPLSQNHKRWSPAARCALLMAWFNIPEKLCVSLFPCPPPPLPFSWQCCKCTAVKWASFLLNVNQGKLRHRTMKEL